MNKKYLPLVKQLFGLALIVALMVAMSAGCKRPDTCPPASQPPKPPTGAEVGTPQASWSEKSQLQNWEAGGDMDPGYINPSFPLHVGDVVAFSFKDVTSKKMTTVNMSVDEKRDLIIPFGYEKRIPRIIDFGTSGFRKGAVLYAVMTGSKVKNGTRIRITAAPPIKVQPGETDFQALAIQAKGWMP